MSSRLLAIIGAVAGIISCIAAVMVIPEVRCMLGLPTDLAAACARRDMTRRALPSTLPLPTQADETVEGSILRIRARFNQVERDLAGGRYDSTRKEVTGLPGDSAYATIYLAGGDVPKIRVRLFNGDVRTSLQSFYDGGTLAFIYRTSNRLLPSGPQEFEQQRFYFSGSRMIRWLDRDRRSRPGASAEFTATEEQMRSFGDRLMQGALSPGPVIDF